MLSQKKVAASSFFQGAELRGFRVCLEATCDFAAHHCDFRKCRDQSKRATGCTCCYSNRSACMSDAALGARKAQYSSTWQVYGNCEEAACVVVPFRCAFPLCVGASSCCCIFLNGLCRRSADLGTKRRCLEVDGHLARSVHKSLVQDLNIQRLQECFWSKHVFSAKGRFSEEF